MGNFIQTLDLTESEDRAADPCWQVKWHLGKLIKKVFGNQGAETVCLVILLFEESSNGRIKGGSRVVLLQSNSRAIPSAAECLH